MPQDYWITELYREKYLKFSMWDGKETSDRKDTGDGMVLKIT